MPGAKQQIDHVVDEHEVASNVGPAEQDGPIPEGTFHNLRYEPARVVIGSVDGEQPDDHDREPGRSREALRVEGGAELRHSVGCRRVARCTLRHRSG